MRDIPQCLSCKHFIDTEKTPPGERCVRIRCQAFQRVPAKIVMNQFAHTKPYPGDHGIRFEPK